MKKILLASYGVALTTMVCGQQSRNIELAVWARYDKHAAYTTRFLDRSYTNDMKLFGTSYGARLNYVHGVTPDLSLVAGAGFYRLQVDRIKGTSPWTNNTNSRTIAYMHPSGIFPMFTTDEYAYNNLIASIGVNYVCRIDKHLNVTAGTELVYMYTFSQYYRIGWGPGISYRTAVTRPMGAALIANVGIVRPVATRWYIYPKLIIPVYHQLHQDRVFGEDEKEKMHKWFSGVGLSVSIGKYLHN